MPLSSRHSGATPAGPARRDILTAAAAAAAAPMIGAGAALAAGRGAGFDFLHGRWDVTHRKLRERLTGNREWFEFPGTLEVAPLVGGLGNLDHNVLEDPGGTYMASSLRLFDPQADAWSVYWLDARAPALEPPVVGRFAGLKGEFFAAEVLRGRPIRVRTTYEPLSPTRAEWTQAFSPDDGATWEINWIMDFRKA